MVFELFAKIVDFFLLGVEDWVEVFFDMGGGGLKKEKRKKLRQPGIEPGSSAWKAPMLTITPLTLLIHLKNK